MTRLERRQRESNKRKKKNKARKVMGWIGAVLINYCNRHSFMFNRVFFQINTISASGRKYIHQIKYYHSVLFKRVKTFFTVNTDEAALRIEENLPYVYKAEIKRKLPDTIEIKVTDAKVAYSLLCED